MTMPDDDELVKVHVDLTGHEETGGEAMWAKPLGGDLYELRNTPFYAYQYNFLDVVEAIPSRPDLKPSVLRLHQPSGHRTVWIQFSDNVSPEECIALATELNEFRAFFESARQRYFAVDVEPDGDYERVIERIAEWRKAGLLTRFRTGPLQADVW